MTKHKSVKGSVNRVRHHVRHPVHWWKNRHLWHRLVAVFLASLMMGVGGMYGIAQWYIHKHESEPLKLGVTFIPSYARYFDLEPQATLRAIFDDLGVKQVRLASYWEDGEPSPGKYDFSDLDWEMKMANEYGVKVSLA